MEQITLGFDPLLKKTRKESFLDEMNIVVPWAELVWLVMPDARGAHQAFGGRPPFPVETMLRNHCLQLWWNLSDRAMEEATIEASVAIGAVKKADLQRVIVDTTVQENAIAYPIDSRLFDVARAKNVRLAKRAGIKLKRTSDCEATALRRRAGGYACVRQFKRLKEVLRRQRTILGILLREVQRKMSGLPQAVQDKLNHWMTLAERIRTQRPKDKNKLYALHAPAAECIRECKARTPFEFGAKVGIAVTPKGNLIVGARAFPGNPYDEHTLAEKIEQTTNLLQDLKVTPTTAIVDLGYRGVDHPVPAQIIHSGRFKTMSALQRRWLKRRQPVEPVIGRLVADHGMSRCWLKGSEADALHTVLCAAGFNLRWLLRAVARMGLGFVLLALTVWVSAARTMQDLHERVSSGGNRLFLNSTHQLPAGVVG
jgi:IS5 family transposase